MEFDTIDSLSTYVATLNIGVKDWSVDELTALEERAKQLQMALASRFGSIEIDFGMQDCSDYARLGPPSAILLDPENPYVCIVLSQFGELASIPYEWDIKPEALAEIKQILDRQGFHYVSYRIFANPVDNDWRYDYGWQHGCVSPPEGKGKLKHEVTWMNLFDYN